MGVTFNPFGAENPVVAILATLTLTLDLTLILTLLYYTLGRFDVRISFIEETLRPRIAEYFTEISLVIATMATTGSLYMSQVLGYEPCSMCWYQRIFMYPLVIILGIGLLFQDENARDYVLGLSMIGFPIAFYHSLVQRFDQFQSAGCSIASVSCSTEYTFWFGFITIPVMAATAFAAIIVLMWRFGRNE